MTPQRAVEGAIYPIAVRIASADLGTSELSVPAPRLLEACGVDGRHVGTARSFPGFRGLAINEAYGGQGPLLVGPGIDHLEMQSADTGAQVSAGDGFSVARLSDGSVLAWGVNDQNQCEIPDPNEDFLQVACGGNFTIGLKTDGTLVAWGSNSVGQCTLPTPNENFTAVAAGRLHALALKSDGSIVAWGENGDGQCTVPSPNSGFSAIGCGHYHSFGIKTADGAIIAWGNNDSGQCTVPSPNTGFASVAGGYRFSLGIKATTGVMVGWGSNSQGQLNIAAPNTGYSQVDCGFKHAVALRTSGVVEAWGWNSMGQTEKPLPNEGFVGIASGEHHSMAVASDGGIKCWGNNNNGECDVPTDTVSGYEWKHLSFCLSRDLSHDAGRIQFFKAVEFKKSQSSSHVVSGFIIVLPYVGPRSAGMVYDTGLPRGPTLHKPVVVFVYWDDAPYPHPFKDWFETEPDDVPPGWRARILNKTCYFDDETQQHVDVTSIQGTLNMDCSSWGRFGYIVNPDVCGTGLSKWGSPSRLVETQTPDGGDGPQVLYYDDDSKFVRLREMGSEVTTDLFDDFRAYAVEDDTNGYLRGAGGGDDGIMFGVTFYDDTTGRRTPMFKVIREHQVGSSHDYFYRADVPVPLDVWAQRLTTMELWRTPIGQPDLYYLEATLDLGDELPEYDAGKDDSEDERTYNVIWGSKIATVTGAWYAHRDGRTIGLNDDALVMQEPWGGYYAFDLPPPDDSTRIVVFDEMAFVVDGKVENSDDEDFAGVVRPAVPARMRWSSPSIPQPENFSDLNKLWYPDETAGMVYGIGRSGGTVYAVGTRGVVAVRKYGDRLVFNNVGEDLTPVSRLAWCVGGGRLYVLSKSGLWVVHGDSGSVQEVAEASRVLFAQDWWGQELATDVMASAPAIGLQYDEAADALVIRNLNGFEALVLWVKSGTLTTLQDFPWQWSTEAAIPSVSDSDDGTHRAGGMQRRAYFFGELGLAERLADTSNAPAYLDVFYIDTEPAGLSGANDAYASGPTGTMHGSATALSGALGADSVWDGSILRGTIGSFTASSVTIMEVRHDAEEDGSSDLVTKMQRRFNGAMVHLWSADGATHVRRMLYWFDSTTIAGTGEDPDTYWARYWLYPTLSADERTALVGGFFAVAPVTFRLVTGLIPDSSGELVGQYRSVLGASFKMDFVNVRRWVDDAGGEVVLTSDASNTLLWAIGLTPTSGELTDETMLAASPEKAATDGELTLAHITSLDFPRPLGRLREAARKEVTPSRAEKDCAVSLRFGGDGVAVGLEGYLCGAQFELVGLRASGNLVQSTRKV